MGHYTRVQQCINNQPPMKGYKTVAEQSSGIRTKAIVGATHFLSTQIQTEFVCVE